jgi:eukaryotic-like serine/threonine-protein kinase
MLFSGSEATDYTEASPRDTLLSGFAPEVSARQSRFERNTVLPRAVPNTPTVTLAARERFEELSSLGRGGMGEVSLAVDHDIDRTVAVKRLAGTTDPDTLARFVEEIRIVGRLEHPNIVPVHDVGVDAEGRYYFVMKHLQGESLETIIERLRVGDAAAHARFSFAARARIVHAVLNALAYAHQRGFVHRDIKPANVMMKAGARAGAGTCTMTAEASSGGPRLHSVGVDEGGSVAQLASDRSRVVGFIQIWSAQPRSV